MGIVVSLDDEAAHRDAQAIGEYLLATREQQHDDSVQVAEAKPESMRADDVTHDGLDYLASVRFLRWYDRLLSAHMAVAGALADENSAQLGPNGAHDEDGRITHALMTVHRTLLAHPTSAKAAYKAIVAEGRVYGRTAEGRELRQKLLTSPRVARVALLWRSVTLGMFVDGEAGELPSTYLDNLLRLAQHDDVPALLARLRELRSQ